MTTSDKTVQGPMDGSVWWRHPMVWLVIGGPAVVVVASFITLGLAITHPDPVLETRVPSADELDARTAAQLPALQGRNHAAAAATRPVLDVRPTVVAPARP